jgi:hydroxymethylpyrimidine pyrophosphatase-like HAD family hydrolase
MSHHAGVAVPRLVACDLDGTLLRGDGTPSARSVQAVNAVQEAGVRFVVATARPPRWLHDLLDVVGEHGLAICSNGAFSYDVMTRRVLRERTMSPQTVLEVVAAVREVLPHVAFAVENRVGFGREPSYLDLYTPPPGTPIADIAELIDPPPGKLLARSPDLAADEFLEAVVAAVGDRAIVAFSGVGGLAEISAPGVTKAAVLQEWCGEWGIDASDVYAFGDMPNDLPMLTWAGTSYAVANAHPLVHAAATNSCPSNDEDGVASVLEEVARRASAVTPDH